MNEICNEVEKHGFNQTLNTSNQEKEDFTLTHWIFYILNQQIKYDSNKSICGIWNSAFSSKTWYGRTISNKY